MGLDLRRRLDLPTRFVHPPSWMRSTKQEYLQGLNWGDGQNHQHVLSYNPHNRRASRTRGAGRDVGAQDGIKRDFRANIHEHIHGRETKRKQARANTCPDLLLFLVPSKRLELLTPALRDFNGTLPPDPLAP